MPLLEKQPDNTAIDAQLRKYGITPSFLDVPWIYPGIDPSVIPPEQWAIKETSVGAWGVIGRQKVMRYDYGMPTAISPAVGNTLSETVKRTLIGEEEIGTETSFSISTTVEAGFFDVVKVSVTSGFSRTWTHKKKFTDQLEVPIRPGYMMWLEVQPVMRTLEGKFVFFMTGMGELQTARQFGGTVTAPGVEGNLKDVIVAREAPMSAGVSEALLSAADAESRAKSLQIRRNDDGTVTLPGFMAATLLGGTATATDVTDQVMPV
ncbi:hypothetical protein ACFWJS_35840 [Streptomyces sp. NPDC127061]|uniref:hypothetical protein n=1 Tax=Streptomyces sp. NPDC127061 TaxID=3347122 RepID=UPI0036636267